MPKLGLRAAPVVAVPETVALPLLYPVREVVAVIVAVAPGASPVTVSRRFDPTVEVTATEPALTVGVAQV